MRRGLALIALAGLAAMPALLLARPAFGGRGMPAHIGQTRMQGPARPGSDDGEFLIDTSIAYGPAARTQFLSALAFDGVNFLVTWEDGRNNDGDRDIYGARITPGGTVLDAFGIPISTAEGHQGEPVVAFGGTCFLVAWQDFRSVSGCDIYAARVTSDGMVLDPAGIAISAAATSQGTPALAFDGTNFLVTWYDDRRGSTDIYGARVTPGGTVLDTAGIPISAAEDMQSHPALVFDGTNYLVTWQDYRNRLDYDIFAARVTPGGAVLDPSGIPISTAEQDQQLPAVAFDGANFLVTWENWPGGRVGIFGARVTREGAVLDPLSFPISTAAWAQYPALAFDGTNYLAMWEDNRNGSFHIYAARVTPGGTALDTAGIRISPAAGYQGSAAVASDGTNCLVTWQTTSNGSWDVYGTRVAPEGTVLDTSGILISTAAAEQGFPALAFDGTNFLVAWQDYRSGLNSDIYAARVAPAGRMLDSCDILISTEDYCQGLPAIAFDGVNFLVTWTDGPNGSGNSDIYGARVTPEGTVLDPSGIPIATAANQKGSSAIGWDGTNFLVTWDDLRGGSGHDIYGARVTPEGMVLDPSGVRISNGGNDEYSPALAFDGANYLVTWEDFRNGSDYDVYGARVTPAGMVLDPQGIPISTGAYAGEFPAVAFDGTDCLVTWEDFRGGTGCSIYGARVTPGGTVLDPQGIPVSAATNDYEYYPTLAFDGTSYLVTWQDYRNGTGNADIHGARLSPAGTVLDSGPVVRQVGDQSYPRLCRGGGSQLFLVYAGWAGAVGGKVYDAQRIWGKVNPNPGVAETPDVVASTKDLGPTIVHGVLSLPAASGPKPQASSCLLDISGRKVVKLKPGANDISRLGPGVYFVREEAQSAGRKPHAVRKVILTR